MGKKVLILDLDETLVHRESTKQPSTSFLIHFLANGKVVTRYICKRPKVDEFLETLKPFYTIHIFTAGYEQFTNKALDVLDPCGDIFESIFYNDSCTYYGEGIYQKDLTKICADLTQAMAIDDTPDAFIHKSNSIVVKPFYNDMQDCELDAIAKFLLSIKDAVDIWTECSS